MFFAVRKSSATGSACGKEAILIVNLSEPFCAAKDLGEPRESMELALRQRPKGAFGSLPYYFLFAASNFCLYIFSASLRTVSETSLLLEMFFKSCGCRCFINPNPRSSGVRGFETRFRTTM